MTIKDWFTRKDKKSSHERYCGATDAGKQREGNEDNFLVLHDKNLYVVADGMGGHNAGEVASLKAVKDLEQYFTEDRIAIMGEKPEEIETELVTSVTQVHESILQMAEEKSEYFGMGTTIVICFIQDHVLHVCHVGDSRAYVVNQTEMVQITNDHSDAWEMFKAGEWTKEEARVSSLKNQIRQALGAPTPIQPEYNRHSLKDGDYILLCSDGLWDMLPDEQINSIMLSHSAPKKTCRALIDEANAAGGEDNITVIVVQV